VLIIRHSYSVTYDLYRTFSDNMGNIFVTENRVIGNLIRLMVMKRQSSLNQDDKYEVHCFYDNLVKEYVKYITLVTKIDFKSERYDCLYDILNSYAQFLTLTEICENKKTKLVWKIKQKCLEFTGLEIPEIPKKVDLKSLASILKIDFPKSLPMSLPDDCASCASCPSCEFTKCSPKCIIDMTNFVLATEY